MFEKLPKLVLLVGISGSGKSTWIQEHQNEWKNTIVVNFDKLRKEMTGDVSDHSMEKEVVRSAFRTIRENLGNGVNVILDATNCHSKNRKGITKYLLKRGVFFRGEAIIFESDPNKSKERIKNDLQNSIDRSRVPDDIIDWQYEAYKSYMTKLRSFWTFGDGFKIVKEYVED